MIWSKLGRIAGTAILAVCLAACGKGAAEDKSAKNGKENKEEADKVEAAIPVETELASRRKIVASYTGTTTLEPEREAQVVAKTAGVLLRLHVEEGDRVRQGQLLAELDPDKTRLEVARTESDLKRLESDYKRATELADKKLISPEAYDRAKFDLDTQRAAHDLAKLELSYTRITAPIDGVISERMVKEGNLIQLHTALFRIDDFDPLLGVLNVPERELTTLKPGLPVSMFVDALPGKTFAGKVQRVSPIVDAGTGTFRVTCEFRAEGNDPNAVLKSGMFGRLNIVYDERADALTIPREALIDEDGEMAVFVAEMPPPEAPKKADPNADKKDKSDDPEKTAKLAAQAAKDKADTRIARRRPVVVGYTSGNYIEIREGLKEGDRVVTVGRSAVRDGTKIQLIGSAP